MCLHSNGVKHLHFGKLLPLIIITFAELSLAKQLSKSVAVTRNHFLYMKKKCTCACNIFMMHTTSTQIRCYNRCRTASFCLESKSISALLTHKTEMESKSFYPIFISSWIYILPFLQELRTAHTEIFILSTALVPV